MFRVELPNELGYNDLISEDFFTDLHCPGVKALIDLKLTEIWSTDSKTKAERALYGIQMLLLGLHLSESCDTRYKNDALGLYTSVQFMKLKRVFDTDVVKDGR